jgi:hypothetical protein
MRIDRENFGAGSHQHDFLIADMAEQGVALEIVSGNALGQIGSRGRRLLFSHVHSRFDAATRQPGKRPFSAKPALTANP